MHESRHTPLDSHLDVPTPEGPALQLHPASLYPRALAFAIDLGIRALLLAVCALPLVRLGNFGLGLGMFLLFTVTWGYMLLFEWLNQGRSPGKQLLGLRVVDDRGLPPGLAASLVRNLLRVVDMLPFGYALGLLASLCNPAFKRFGDLAAGTLVIHEPHTVRQASPSSAALRIPLPPALTREQRELLLAFAERASGLSTARRQELLAPLAQSLQRSPQQIEAQLLGLARELREP